MMGHGKRRRVYDLRPIGRHFATYRYLSAASQNNEQASGVRFRHYQAVCITRPVKDRAPSHRSARSEFLRLHRLVTDAMRTRSDEGCEPARLRPSVWLSEWLSRCEPGVSLQNLRPGVSGGASDPKLRSTSRVDSGLKIAPAP